MADLEKQFAAAVEKIETAEGDFKPSNDLKLQMYALYKQSTTGDVSGKKPGTFDVVGKAKWNAWTRLKGTSKEKAMQTYIAQLEQFFSEDA